MNIPYRTPEEWKFNPEEWKFNPCKNKKNNVVINENPFDWLIQVFLPRVVQHCEYKVFKISISIFVQEQMIFFRISQQCNLWVVYDGLRFNRWPWAWKHFKLMRKNIRLIQIPIWVPLAIYVFVLWIW